MKIPFISDAFGWLFNLLFQFSNEYILTLFLFAVIMKVILLPFGIKQQKNSIKQAKLRPKEMAIRNKYKGRNDKATQQKMSEEIMKLYQEENFNPASGCLPMLIQLPILFSLYYVITHPFTYLTTYGTEVFNKLKDAVTAASIKMTSNYPEIDIIKQVVENNEKIGKFFGDNVAFADIVENLTPIAESFETFGVDFSVKVDLASPYILIPILTFVFSFVSTKLIRKFTYQPTTNADPSTKASMTMMDWMMPLMSVYISTITPAAIAVYWIFQNILSVLQQILLYKLFPIPAVSEEEIKEAEMQLKGKQKKAEKQKAIPADYEVDDYDKTTETDKSKGSTQKKEAVLSSHKAGISPKAKEIVQKTGKAPKARKKI